MKTVGQRIIMLREDRNMLQEDLAKELNTTPATLSRYETDITFPKGEVILKLTKIFNCSSDFILGLTEIKDRQDQLTLKDKKDIEKSLNRTINMLEEQDGLMLSGELIDENDFELFKSAVLSGLEYAKKVNKVKYNPNKNKK